MFGTWCRVHRIGDDPLVNRHEGWFTHQEENQ
jgi:hypothetical protein